MHDAMSEPWQELPIFAKFYLAILLVYASNQQQYMQI
jgi:hypothetical protein